MIKSKWLWVMLFLCSGWTAWGQKVTILDHKDRIRISPVSILNSRERETNLSITPDGKYLYFMTVRGLQPWSNQFMTFNGQPIFDGDIWYSKKNASNTWTTPKCLPYGINTASGEDEPNIAPDGKTVTFQSWKTLWQADDGPYYSAQLNGNTWTAPRGLGGGITQFFLETGFNATDGMTISPDGKTFIVACGMNYDGDMDLYISRKKNGVWTYLKRLGISTSKDERSCFIAGDGKTLYFASDGYKGFGGLDIFKVEMNADGSFGDVINVGAPFNTPKDDYGFIMTRDGIEAYFVRDGDIYFADLTEADERIKPEVEVKLSGVVKDEITQKTINAATIIITDATTKKQVNKLKTSSNGKFALTLPNLDKKYTIEVVAEGYNGESKRVEVSKTPFEHSYQANFELAKPAPAQVAAVPQPQAPQAPVAPPTPPKPQFYVPAEPYAEINWQKAPRLPYVKNATPIVPKSLSTPEEKFSFKGYATNHLILLLDISGSMTSRDRLPLLKRSFREMLEYMRAEDRVTIIAYSGNVSVLIENAAADNKEPIENALKNLMPGGKTKSKIGLKKAIEIAEAYYINGGNNRIIMATDGAFDVPDVYKYANKAARNNIFLSVFSFGKVMSTKQEQLRGLANRGNGNFSQITADNVEECLLKEAKAIRIMGK